MIIDQSLSLSLFIQYLINTNVIIKTFCFFFDRQKINFTVTVTFLTSAIVPCAMTYLWFFLGALVFSSPKVSII